MKVRDIINELKTVEDQDAIVYMPTGKTRCDDGITVSLLAEVECVSQLTWTVGEPSKDDPPVIIYPKREED